MANKKKKDKKFDLTERNFNNAVNILHNHPMFSSLAYHARFVREKESLCPEDGWAVITNKGVIYVNFSKKAETENWVYVLAHCLLHLGFNHFKDSENFFIWNTVCDCFIAKFLKEMKLGTPPREFSYDYNFRGNNEEKLYNYFVEEGIPNTMKYFGTAGNNHCDMIMVNEREYFWTDKVDWQKCFAQGLNSAVTSAVNVAGGYEAYLGANKEKITPGKKAKKWFINSYPLLGAVASSFEIIEDNMICQRMNISVAAVNPQFKEIYINPAAGMDEYECRFVMAHEFLHVCLGHHSRRRGRDPYLWNIACDYVINGWLLEMGLGELPKIGALHDIELKGLSAEEIYDRIVTDIRKYRKLATLRGCGLSDILEGDGTDWWNIGDGITLDEFYKKCLSQGLQYHEDTERGFLPAGLIEEIKALSQPSILWDVELAKWFDNYFAPIEKVRSYARQSRRQSSTPDIPRPRWVYPYGIEDGRTFGVLIDTSGSMDRVLLAKALGTIASYSMSRDVPYVRVIFCDAAVYDEGYMSPEAIADKVKVKGRGGTILQPGIDILEKTEDFPKDGPILIITDGFCDKLRIKRKHAFLIPEGRSLPFVTKGEVFKMK